MVHVYRKTYSGFILWLIVFVIAMLAICFLPVDNEAVLIRLLLNLTTLSMAQLTWMIWRSERVYWYNGITFEEAEKAGSERRKAYAFRHFRLFGGYALVALAASMAAHLARLPWWADFTFICVGMIAAAFRTMKYKL